MANLLIEKSVESDQFDAFLITSVRVRLWKTSNFLWSVEVSAYVHDLNVEVKLHDQGDMYNDHYEAIKNMVQIVEAYKTMPFPLLRDAEREVRLSSLYQRRYG